MRGPISIFIRASLCLALLVFAQCGDDTNNPAASPNTDVSLTHDIQPIFNASCAVSGCHNVAAAAQLNLSAGKSYSSLVEVNANQDATQKRVQTGDAMNSYLVVKIEGRQKIGSKMPPGSALSVTQIQAIKNWIDQGAKNN
ncbi:hypothetical protein L0128_15950 [candidate division KSB1 bacterium]|nr:hypothetical protein [candidate division KSB1 bacterium]